MSALTIEEEAKIRRAFRYKGRISKSMGALAWYGLCPVKFNGLIISGGTRIKHLSRQTVNDKPIYDEHGVFKVDSEGYADIMEKIESLVI